MEPNSPESDANCEAEFYEAVVYRMEERKVQKDDYITSCRLGLEYNRELRAVILEQIYLVGLINILTTVVFASQW